MNPDVEQVMMEVKLRYFQGCGNTCPKCGEVGNFGSVARVKVPKTKKEFLVCGWCGEVSEIK